MAGALVVRAYFLVFSCTGGWVQYISGGILLLRKKENRKGSLSRTCYHPAEPLRSRRLWSLIRYMPSISLMSLEDQLMGNMKTKQEKNVVQTFWANNNLTNRVLLACSPASRRAREKPGGFPLSLVCTSHHPGAGSQRNTASSSKGSHHHPRCPRRSV